jgi:hypothetical protein
MNHLGDDSRPKTVRGSVEAFLATLHDRENGLASQSTLRAVVAAVGPDQFLVDVDNDQLQAVLEKLERTRDWPADGRQTVTAWLAWTRSTEIGTPAGEKPTVPLGRVQEAGGYREIRWGRSGIGRPGTGRP